MGKIILLMHLPELLRLNCECRGNVSILNHLSMLLYFPGFLSNLSGKSGKNEGQQGDEPRLKLNSILMGIQFIPLAGKSGETMAPQGNGRFPGFCKQYLCFPGLLQTVSLFPDISPCNLQHR